MCWRQGGQLGHLWLILIEFGVYSGMDFRSGDILVFDPSTKAKVLRGIESIVHQEEDAYKIDDGLIQRHPTLKQYRFGIQCRAKPA